MLSSCTGVAQVRSTQYGAAAACTSAGSASTLLHSGRRNARSIGTAVQPSRALHRMLSCTWVAREGQSRAPALRPTLEDTPSTWQGKRAGERECGGGEAPQGAGATIWQASRDTTENQGLPELAQASQGGGPHQKVAHARQKAHCSGHSGICSQRGSGRMVAEQSSLHCCRDGWSGCRA